MELTHFGDLSSSSGQISIGKSGSYLSLACDFTVEVSHSHLTTCHSVNDPTEIL